jgi:hypothetical protein
MQMLPVHVGLLIYNMCFIFSYVNILHGKLKSKQVYKKPFCLEFKWNNKEIHLTYWLWKASKCIIFLE